MLILTLRTEKPEAEIGLYIDQHQIDYKTWTAHRQLAESLHNELTTLLKDNQKSWGNIEAIAVYKGPGSFTGLRIGLSVANAIAISNQVSIVSVSGDQWIDEGINILLAGKGDKIALPEYGAPVHTTKPKK